MLLLKILLILLALVLGFFLLLLLAALPRAGVRIHSKDEQLTVWVRYGWLKLRIYPLRLDAESQKKARKKRAKTDKPKTPGFDPKSFNFGEAVYLGLELLEELREALRLEVIRVQVCIGTGNAATTGIILGSCAAIISMITPFLMENFRMHTYEIAVDGDFEAERSHWDAAIAFSVRPIRLLWSLVRRWKRIKQLISTTQKTEANVK